MDAALGERLLGGLIIAYVLYTAADLALPSLQVCLTQSVLKSVCGSQLPHKSFKLSFTITYIDNKLTDVLGN